MNDLPLSVLVFLIIAAVALGLYLGAKAGASVDAHTSGNKRGTSMAARLRSAASNGIVRLWVWNRDRKKPRNDDDAA